MRLIFGYLKTLEITNLVVNEVEQFFFRVNKVLYTLVVHNCSVS